MKSEQLAWLIRRHGIEMTHLSGGSHIGAIMSVADIMAVLYSCVLKFKTHDPKWNERDRFILSKGHAGASVYAALAESGFFDVEELKTHYANGSRLSGHVSHHLPGVEFSTGSLGHGLSVGIGMAYALKKNQKASKVYVVVGDGECNEGSVWEAAQFARHYQLDNVVAIVDYNQMQSMDFCDNTLEVVNMCGKWNSFGWNVIEINGHNHDELKDAFEREKKCVDKPTVIIANTIKGYGISFMENDILWHYRFPHEGWEYDQAVSELHKNMPEGIKDPYTPNGVENPVEPDANADIFNDHTMTFTWKPDFPQRRVKVRL